MRKKDYITPNDFRTSADNDIQAISQAIACAVETGCRTLRIPKYNERTDSFVWVLDDAIRLPSNFTLLLDNCHLRLGDDTFCNIICNENCHRNCGEQENIHIRGLGRVILDGGKYNGYSEHSSYLPKPLYHNCSIMLHNVNGFSVENLHICNHRYWGLTFMFCSEGTIRNIDFKADLSTADDNGGNIPGQLPLDYEHVYLQNSDGIDLRLGCKNILIENISGFTVDDTVALTALVLRSDQQKDYLVKDKPMTIHDVVIKNIRSYTFCWTGQVRLLAKDGCQIYNITVDTVINTLNEDSVYRGGCSVMIGDTGYVRVRDTEMGDIYNVSVSNIHSRAVRAVRLTGPMSFIDIEKIYAYSGVNTVVDVDCGAEFKHVNIHGIYCGEDCGMDTVINFSSQVTGSIKVSDIYCSKADYLIRNLSGTDIDLKNYDIDHLGIAEKTMEPKYYKFWYLD